MATEASEPIATAFITAIEKSFAPLLQFPLSGASRKQIAPGLRVVFHSPYAVYYTATADALVIVRILYGARDISVIAEDGGIEW